MLLAAPPGGETHETWTFDLCANTWTAMHPNQEPDVNHGQLVYDAGADVTIAVDTGPARRVWAYNLAANTWTMEGEAPMASLPSRAVYDPASGLIVAMVSGATETNPSELWTYDVATDTWTPIREAGATAVGPTPAGLLAYDASVDRIIAYNPGLLNGSLIGTWLFDLRTGTWSKSGVVTPLLNLGWFPSGGEIATTRRPSRPSSSAMVRFSRTTPRLTAGRSWTHGRRLRSSPGTS